MSAHPRIDAAIADVRSQFPTMPDAATLAPMLARKEVCDNQGRAYFTLADGSEWMLISIDLEADTLKLWRRR